MPWKHRKATHGTWWFKQPDNLAFLIRNHQSRKAGETLKLLRESSFQPRILRPLQTFSSNTVK
jgi:hypothetical protein